MRLKRIAAVLLVLVAVLIAAAVVAIRFLDPDSLVRAAADQVRKSTGRELAFGGGTEISLFPRPAIVLNEVRLRNAAWGSQPWMASIGRVEAEMKLLPLLAGRISISQIRLADATVLLETDSKGNGNWVLGSSAAGPVDLSWLTGLQIALFTLHSAKLSYRDGMSGRTTHLPLEAVTLHAPTLLQPIRFHGHGSFSGKKLEVRGEFGGLASLLGANRPYPILIEGTLGGAKLEIRGKLNQPAELSASGLDLSAQGEELAELAELAGRSIPALGAYRIGAHLSGSWNAPRLSGIEITVGTPARMRFEARGAAALRLDANGPSQVSLLDLALSAQGAELHDLLELTGESVPPLGPYRMTGRLSGTGEAPKLSGIEIAVGAPGRMEFDARGELGLRTDGAEPLRTAAFDLALSAQGPEFKDLIDLAGEPVAPVGPYRIAARLSGSWDSPRLSGIEVAVGSPDRTEFKARGAVENARDARGLDLRVAVAARHWWRFSERADAPLLPPFRLSTWVHDRPPTYVLDDFLLELAGSRVNATVVATREERRVHIAAKVASPLIDLAHVIATADSAAPRETARADERKSSRWPVILEYGEVDLDLQLGKLILRDGRALTGLSGHFTLDREGLKVASGHLIAGGASVSVGGNVRQPLQASGLDLKLAIQGSELADLFKFGGKPIPAVGPYRASARALGSLTGLQLTGIDATAGRPAQARARATGKIDDALNGKGIDLAVALEISDFALLSRLTGQELPPLPPAKLSAQVTAPQGGYAFDDLKLALGRSALQGRVAVAPGKVRPSITASLNGPTFDLSEFTATRGAAKAPAGNPLAAADVDADIRLDRLVLPDKRVLKHVGGRVRLEAGALELRQVGIALDGASAILDGKLADPPRFAGLDLTVHADIKRMEGIAGFTRLNLPRLPPFTASGRVSDVQNGYAVNALKLAFPVTAVTGEIAVTRGPTRLKVSAKLDSPVFDVPEFRPAAPEAQAASPRPPETRVFSDAPLPFSELKLADADLDLKIGELRFRHAAALGPIIVRGTLAGGRLDAELLRIAVKETQYLEVTGTMDGSSGKTAKVALRIEGKSIDLGQVLTRMGEPGAMTGGATDLKLVLSGRGNTVRSIMAGLNGSATIKVGPGLIHHANLDLGRGIIETVLDLVNPFRKSDPDTDMKCVAINVPIAAGVVKSDRSIAFETAKFNAIASGTVNLATETLAMGVTPIVTQGLGLGTDQLVQVVSIGGTIAKPDIGVGAAGAARTAASLGADVATAGSWLLIDALVRRTTSDPHPCATALGER